MSRQIYLDWDELRAIETMIAALRAAFDKGDGTIATRFGTVTWHPKGIALSLPDVPSGVTDDIAEILDARIKAAQNGG